MKVASLAREHIVGWTVVSVGVGACAATALIGVPPLWSAEAAGWAAAFGTMAAVVVSLDLARGQRKKESSAQRSRARWVALELRQLLAVWRRRVTYAYAANSSELLSLLHDDAFRDPMVVPPELLALNNQLHELGDDAAPIADAIWIARQLQQMPICEALKGGIASHLVAEAVEKQFRAGLGSLRQYLLHAEQNVSAITGLTAANPETFGGPHSM